MLARVQLHVRLILLEVNDDHLRILLASAIWNFMINRLPKKEDSHCEVFSAIDGSFLSCVLEETCPAGSVAIAVQAAGGEANGDFKTLSRRTSAGIG
jgi:hypothetical protein